MVEHYLHTVGVVGSKPTARTIFTGVFEEIDNSRTVTAQFPAETKSPKLRFPKRIRYRREEATIYGTTEKYAFYRLVYYVAGKRIPAVSNPMVKLKPKVSELSVTLPTARKLPRSPASNHAMPSLRSNGSKISASPQAVEFRCSPPRRNLLRFWKS